EIQRYTQQVTPLIFPDHHAFTTKDIANIQSVYQSLLGKGRIWVITTEKDATRISTSEGWNQEFMENLWSLPIEVKILEGKEQEFNNRICKELK
ncbi:MAG: tetraacyldisaccharide 4'-kinase, partial [Bacteroidaceae bacterium]|nr:tetraacyldisaccharide 4'-kinase [Bacteroidaceae bacterium]